MNAIYVLVGAGMKDRREVGMSVVMNGCPEDGPQMDVLAHARDLVTWKLTAQGVGGIGFELFRDRSLEDRTEKEEAGK